MVDRRALSRPNGGPTVARAGGVDVEAPPSVDRLLLLQREHVLDRTGDGIERTARLNPRPVEPVVFDELEDRALIDQRVIDVVLLRERGDHQERDAGSVTAAPLGWACAAVDEWNAQKRRGGRC